MMEQSFFLGRIENPIQLQSCLGKNLIWWADAKNSKIFKANSLKAALSGSYFMNPPDRANNVEAAIVCPANTNPKISQHSDGCGLTHFLKRVQTDSERLVHHEKNTLRLKTWVYARSELGSFLTQAASVKIRPRHKLQVTTVDSIIK